MMEPIKAATLREERQTVYPFDGTALSIDIAVIWITTRRKITLKADEDPFYRCLSSSGRNPLNYKGTCVITLVSGQLKASSVDRARRCHSPRDRYDFEWFETSSVRNRPFRS
jgi:hypothetical protein